MTKSSSIHRRKPARARTAFNFFFAQESLKIRSDALSSNERRRPYSEVSKIVVRRWKQIGARDKAVFQEMAAEDKRRFDLELIRMSSKEPSCPGETPGGEEVTVTDSGVQAISNPGDEAAGTVPFPVPVNDFHQLLASPITPPRMLHTGGVSGVRDPAVLQLVRLFRGSQRAKQEDRVDFMHSN